MGGIRRDTVPAADAAVFRPLFIAIPWTRNPGPMLIFSRFQGARQHDWPIICRLYPIYHRCIVRVIRFNRVSMPRKSEKTKISPSSPPRYAHAFFYLSDRWPGPMQKPWTIYFNGRGIKRTGTRVPLTIIRVAVEKQTS